MRPVSRAALSRTSQQTPTPVTRCFRDIFENAEGVSGIFDICVGPLEKSGDTTGACMPGLETGRGTGRPSMQPLTSAFVSRSDKFVISTAHIGQCIVASPRDMSQFLSLSGSMIVRISSGETIQVLKALLYCPRDRIERISILVFFKAHLFKVPDILEVVNQCTIAFL